MLDILDAGKTDQVFVVLVADFARSTFVALDLLVSEKIRIYNFY